MSELSGMVRFILCMLCQHNSTVCEIHMFAWQGLLQSLKLMKANKRKFTILDGLSGRVAPGRMTLLLGPPGSGKSTLLSALAGKLRKSDLQIKGSITYNGHTFDDFIPERTASYIDQTDTHLAELTVRETFDFAARCQGTGHKGGRNHAHAAAFAVHDQAEIDCTSQQ